MNFGYLLYSFSSNLQTCRKNGNNMLKFCMDTTVSAVPIITFKKRGLDRRDMSNNSYIFLNIVFFGLGITWIPENILQNLMRFLTIYKC